MCSGKGIYAVLLGSGISRAAGIPTGWDVTLDLVRRFARLSGADAGEQPDHWFRQVHSAEPEYSALLEALAKSPAERRSLLQAYFEPSPDEREQGLKTPTAAHRAIANLVASGHIRVIVTTNFDRLMEIALSDAGITPAVISNGDQAAGAAPLVHQRCVLVKLHGDYLDDRIMNTEAELSTYDSRMAAKLDQILDEFGLIVSGWSGDWDAALRAAFSRCPSRRYTTYWGAVGEPSPRAAALIAHRQAQVVRVNSADALFTSLEEKVRSLEEMQTTAPISVAAAVATLKRYLAEDRQRIRLDDMVREEAFRVAKIVDAALPRSQPPDAATAIAAVQAIDNQTEILRALFFHGCRISRAEQGDVFVGALRLMLPEGRWFNIRVFEAWAALRFYPMGSIMYAGAFGAVCSRNWSLLRKLLTMKFKSDVAPARTGTFDLAVISTLSESVANSLKPNNRTAASDHVVDLLALLAVGLVPNPEDLFDELETWIGLAAADAHLRLKRSSEFVPPGRFMWRGSRSARYPTAIFEDAEQAGTDWPPLRAGWFGGTLEGFTAAKAHFEAHVQRMAQISW